MPGSTDFIPAQDALALVWMQNFADNILSSYVTYQLSLLEAQTIATAVQEFADAFDVANNTLTRNETTVNIKNTKRNAAETLCRQTAIQIKFNNGITDAQKIAIGVRPVNMDRDPRYCPQTSPMLNITGNTPGAQTVKYADSLDLESRGKPFGATALQLFIAIKDTPTVNEDDAVFLGLYTKNPIVVAFDPADDGKVATYFGRWCGTRGDTGQWSLPVSMRIAA